MKNKASLWLKEKRGKMSYRELARLIGLTHTTVANAEEGDATAETWIKIAEHFKESPSKVLMWAEKTIVKPSDEDVQDEWVQKMAIQINKLPAESKNLVEHLIQYLWELEHGGKEK